MKVKRNERSNTFCGPAALSLITHKHVDNCVKEIHALYKRDGFLSGGRRRSVRGVSRFEMLQVLTRLGYDAQVLPVVDKPTLVSFRRWLRERGTDAKRIYLLNVTGHWMVMRGIKLFDNANPEGVTFGKYTKRRRRVQRAWVIARRDEPSV
jgi:hypothetical protein